MLDILNENRIKKANEYCIDNGLIQEKDDIDQKFYLTAE
jgi:hypothetical protein